jgi:quinoprotein dehydrogenase-associated probable ABC transporter substrate-binding protein
MRLTRCTWWATATVVAVSLAAHAVALAQPQPAPGANAAADAADTGPLAPGNITTLKVCSDAHNMPQSNDKGQGYENKIAEALARDLKRKLQYTYFPQRMGFVRNTLRAVDDTTHEFKCDLIVGVPKGYELTATTQPYMRSTYAMVVPERPEFKSFKNATDVLSLPPEQLKKLRIGIFAQTPASDWLLAHGLLDHAALYAAQSGDPNENPQSVVGADLDAGKIDATIVWGPVAGYLVNRHSGGGRWIVLPFKPDPRIRFDYEMSMGVRFGEKEWKDTIDGWIGAHRPEINQILAGYHIPLLDEKGEILNARN